MCFSKFSRRAFLLLILSLVAVSSLDAQPGRKERESLKLLTIGNSFADNALASLPGLAKAGGKELIFFKANIGGCSLERHARHLRQAEAGDPAGHAYKNITHPITREKRDYSLPEALASAKWDVVTIQQVSTASYLPETFQPHADELIAAVRKYAPGAEIVVHQTWAYRADHNLFRKGDGLTPEKMYQGLRRNYLKLAEDNGLRILPSGDAFFFAQQSPRWDFARDPDFDYAKPVPENLPDEPKNLYVGARWIKDKTTGKLKFSIDSYHANRAGQYLAGAVWYLMLFDASVVPDSYLPKDLDSDAAADLRKHALAAVQAERERFGN